MRKSFIGAVAGTAALALVATIAGPASAATTPSQKATGYLAGELTAGVVHNGQFNFDDYGLTVDFGFAFVATGKKKQAAKVKTALAGHVDDYTTGAAFGSPDDVYAGSAAKLLSFAEAAGATPTSYGGVDLVDRVEDTVAPSGPIQGRIEDIGADDYANVIGQAYAVRGLTRADSPKSADALDFLLKQQCDQGYFRLNFTPNKAAADQTCDGGTAKESPADTDATAIAVLSLIASGADSDEAKAAIKFGTVWLKSKQRDNGGFGGGPTTTGVNANSTALAGWVLASRGACGPAKDAAKFLQGKQLTKNYGTPRFDEKGAVAYDGKALKDAKARGIRADTQDQFRRATAQSAPTLLALTKAGCEAL